jgi:hypothetical protein
VEEFELINHLIFSAGLMVLLLLGGPVTSAEYPVAGLEPDQRPAGAPVVEQVEKDDAWYQQALTGITQPYPHSLRFLEDQGNWYTPFNHPGMLDRYDIRRWHDGE